MVWLFIGDYLMVVLSSELLQPEIAKAAKVIKMAVLIIWQK